LQAMKATVPAVGGRNLRFLEKGGKILRGAQTTFSPPKKKKREKGW